MGLLGGALTMDGDEDCQVGLKLLKKYSGWSLESSFQVLERCSLEDLLELAQLSKILDRQVMTEIRTRRSLARISAKNWVTPSSSQMNPEET